MKQFAFGEFRNVIRWGKTVALCLAVCALELGFAWGAHAATFTTFDAPGAVNGTFPLSINPAGAITGYYADASYVSHGFLRAPDGTLTTFDAPGAFATNPRSINPAGAITGYYVDASGIQHGFLRSP